MTGLDIIRDPGPWRAAYERLHRPSEMARYETVAAAAMLEEGGRAEAAVLELGGELLLHPYVRRPCPYDPALSDLVSPYEFGGFWFSTDDGERRRQLATAFEAAFQAHAETHGTVSEFIRFHPHGGGADAGWRGYDVVEAAAHVVVPLDDGYPAAHAGIAKNKRRDVRLAERAGLTARFESDLTTFVTMYHANLDRLGADAFYYFPAEHLAALGERLLFVTVANAEGEACAIHAWLRDGERLLLYLAASIEAARPLMPNDFAFDAAMRHAAECGCRLLHLGGGAPSLYWFKSRFSDARVPYFIGRRVFLRDAYDALAARHGTAAAAHFPAYRAPRP